MLARKMIAAMIMLILASMSAAGWGFVGADKGDSRPKYVPGEIIVKFKPEVTKNAVSALARSRGASVERKLRLRNRNVHLLKVPSHINEINFIRQLEKNPNVIYAERNAYVDFMNQLVPDDPNYGQQWALNNIGQFYPIHGGNDANGTNGADIDAPEGWSDVNDVFGRIGDLNIVIAIVDSGVDMNHPDLANIIWVNTGEIPDNGIDDDNNVFVDDVHGWDFDANDNNPQDEFGHGTHCAGIAAADTNNNTCVAGVAWGCAIMPVRVAMTIDSIVEGIEYAADNGASVISLSLGSPPSQTLGDAVSSAYDANCVVVAAAGNFGDAMPVYPASFPEVISVSATDSNDELASFSSFGKNIDVAAPGVDILSLRATGTDAYIEFREDYTPGDAFYPYDDENATMYIASGTSCACPHVAGLVALCRFVDPNLMPDEIKWLICNSSDDLGANGWDKYYGYGRINAYKAVHGAMYDPCQSINPFPENGANDISVNVDLSWEGSGALSYDVYFGADYNDVNNANTSSNEFAGNQPDRIFDQNTLDPNTTYYWRIDAINNQNNIAGIVWSFTTGSNLGIYYVDANANPNGDGGSWANAFNELRDALEVGLWSGDEIWVAEEIYRPTDGNDRLISFELVEGVALYGGFDGTETARNERDWEEHETILSGDIGTVGIDTDNSYHVVIGADNATLDGFIITRGNANKEYPSGSNGPEDDGSGMFNNVSSPIVENCIFRENNADKFGAGMYNYWGSPSITNCIFSDNTAHSGGGMDMKYSAQSVVIQRTMAEGFIMLGAPQQ